MSTETKKFVTLPHVEAGLFYRLVSGNKSTLIYVVNRSSAETKPDKAWVEYVHWEIHLAIPKEKRGRHLVHRANPDELGLIVKDTLGFNTPSRLVECAALLKDEVSLKPYKIEE